MLNKHRFSTLLVRRWGQNIFLEGKLDGKGVVNFWKENLEFLEILNINFTSWLLLDLLFACTLKDVVSLTIFHLCF